MLTPKRQMVIATLFAVPIVCCFLGIGAFLQVCVSYLDRQHQQAIEQQKQEHAELKDHVAVLDRAARDIEEEIEKEDGRNSRADEELEQEKEQADKADGIKKKNKSLNNKQEQLKKQLDALLAQIAELEKDLDKLSSAPKDNAGQLASKQELEQRLKQAEGEQQRLLKELDRVHRELEDAKKERIVTELPAGTRRHPRNPVYLECTASKAIIRPEGKELGSTAAGNDRDTFLAAAKRSRYVVFMVRPDGYESFYAYRNVILSTNKSSSPAIDFGFEPVNADWNLIYPGQEG